MGVTEGQENEGEEEIGYRNVLHLKIDCMYI